MKYLTKNDLKDIAIDPGQLKQAQVDSVEDIKTYSPQAGPSRGALEFESEPTTVNMYYLYVRRVKI